MQENFEHVGFFEKSYMVPVRLFYSLKNFVNTNILEADESLKQIFVKDFTLLTYEDVEKLSDYLQQNYAVFRKHVKDTLPETREEFEKKKLGGCGKIWQTAKQDIITTLLEKAVDETYSPKGYISNTSIGDAIKSLNQDRKNRVLKYLLSSKHKDKINNIAQKQKDLQAFLYLFIETKSYGALDEVLNRVDPIPFSNLLNYWEERRNQITQFAAIVDTYDPNKVAEVISKQKECNYIFRIDFTSDIAIDIQLLSIELSKNRV